MLCNFVQQPYQFHMRAKDKFEDMEQDKTTQVLKKSLQIFCLGQVFLGCVLILTVLPSAVTSWRKSGAAIFATFWVVTRSTFSHVKLDLTECCFCKKSFMKVRAHYKCCPERRNEEYQHLLSERTLGNCQKSKKVACQTCGKSFLRIETHLRNSSKCKIIHPSHPLPSLAAAQPPL